MTCGKHKDQWSAAGPAVTGMWSPHVGPCRADDAKTVQTMSYLSAHVTSCLQLVSENTKPSGNYRYLVFPVPANWSGAKDTFNVYLDLCWWGLLLSLLNTLWLSKHTSCLRATDRIKEVDVTTVKSFIGLWTTEAWSLAFCLAPIFWDANIS